MLRDTLLKKLSIVFLLLPFSSTILAAQVVANGISITLDGGTASTTANNEPAILSLNNGLVTSNGANVTTTGSNSNGAVATLNGQIIFNGSFISTIGLNSAGVSADSGGIITLNGPTIQTTGMNAAGLLSLAGGVISGPANVFTTGNFSPAASAAGGKLTYTGGSISTQGSSSPLFAASGSGILTASGFGASTSGANSPGASATGGGSITLSSGNIQTFGVGSFGAFSSGSSSNISISSFSIQTFNSNSSGLVAQNNGSISFTNASITTSGVQAHALFLSNGGIINLSSGSASATGSNSFGLNVDNSAGTASSTFNISNANLSSSSADAIHVSNASLVVNANQGTINAGSNNIFLFVDNGLANIFGDNASQFNGNIISTGVSTVNLSLTNNSMWSGAATSLTNLNIDSSSAWNMEGSSIVNTATNAGNIVFVPDDNNFKTLTVNNYLGQNGTIMLNTFLAGDGSPSDLLIIDGGSATGITGLLINNTNGEGAVTEGNGIQVVNVINGGVTSSEAFELAAPVVAGPYEYFLIRGARDGSNPEAWYLVDTFDNPPDPDNPDTDPPFVPNDNIPTGRNIPFYRREVSLADAIPAVQLLYDHLMVDTLHQRVGEREQLICRQPCRPVVNGVWLRAFNQGGHFDNNGIYRSGPAFNYNFNALQMGVDVFHVLHRNGGSSFAGVLIGYGKQHGNVDHLKLVNAGRNNFDAWTGGAYYTYYDPHGWYLDTVVLDTFHQGDADSLRGLPSILTNGSGLAGSVEGGYKIALPWGIGIEPEAQIIAERLWVYNSRDREALISWEPTNSFVGRLGARLTHTWKIGSACRCDSVTGWLFGNVWREFEGESRTIFASQAGDVPFISDLDTNWTQTGVGITATLGRVVSIYGSGQYIHYWHDHGHSRGGVVGVRFNL